MADLYTCKRCGGEFVNETTHEEMMTEYEETFGPLAEDEPVVRFCDDCYEVLLDWAKEQGIINA